MLRKTQNQDSVAWLIPHQTILEKVELALTISGVSREERTRRAKRALTQVGLGEQFHK